MHTALVLKQSLVGINGTEEVQKHLIKWDEVTVVLSETVFISRR